MNTRYSSRRRFLATSTGLTSAVTYGFQRGVASPNNTIRLGIIGCGGRAKQLLALLVKRTDIEFVTVCDVDQSKYAPITSLIEDATGKVPKREQDFRRMLDDADIDAVLITTGPNWHSLATIWACQAGKDVFVEKPLSLTLHEGRMAAEAARKYQRVVQVGTQTQSAPDYRAAVEYVRSGKLGEVHLLRAMEYSGYHAYQQPPQGISAAPPDGLDWDMYCGPAEKLPFASGTWWRSHYIYGYGTLDHACHQMDLARGFISDLAPHMAFSSGGIHHRADGRTSPDSHFITIEFDRVTIQAQYMKWCGQTTTPFHTFDPSGNFPNWAMQNGVSVIGSRGILFTGRHGAGWQVYQRKGKSQFVEASYPQVERGIVESGHLNNWLECLRSRKKTNADIEHAHRSISLLHIANASFEAGCRKLDFDAKLETFTNLPEANKYLKRSGRGPWIIPDRV
jgi:predicted dehydrogenase